MTQPGPRKRRAQIIGGCRHGTSVLVQNEDGGSEVIHGRHLEDGKAVPPGSKLHTLSESADGGLVLETIIDGPPKVASPAYRKNYDAIFGKKKGSKLN